MPGAGRAREEEAAEEGQGAVAALPTTGGEQPKQRVANTAREQEAGDRRNQGAGAGLVASCINKAQEG